MKYITHDIITLGKRTVIMPPNINVIEYLTEAIKIKNPCKIVKRKNPLRR